MAPVLIALILIAGCAPGSTSSPAGVAGLQTTRERDLPAAAERASDETLAAAQVAAAYATADCTFSWREPYGQRERRASAYLTPARARAQALSRRGRATWQATVVRNRLASSCRVLDDHVLSRAPSTPDRCQLRVVVRRLISQGGHRPASDEIEYRLVLVLLDGTWRVDAAGRGG
jgi:hypothetical protein